MFTGIVEHVGTLLSIEVRRDLARLEIDCGPVAHGAKLGDSVLVNGACLTVTAIEGERLCFDAVRETLEKTAIGSLEKGDGVHLERAMRADGRFDGHIVQGHVDGQGRVRALERSGDDVRFRVDCSAEFADLLVDKGSVTIDGVSLTVVDPEPEGFHVVLIPHTLERTTLGERAPGSPLNLEADVLGKYVKRYLERVR
jgi:riboflavin synthase